MDVLASAAKHEKEAINLYRYLSYEASLENLKRLFVSLLNDKENNFERIANYRARLDVDTCGHGENELESLFMQIVMDRGIEGLCEDEISFYWEVMKYEKRGISQYESFLSKATDDNLKKLLEGILSKEKKHYDIVKGLCVFIYEQHHSI